jgi:putative ABC transport system permease protein
MSHDSLAARLRASLADYSQRQPPGSKALQLRVSAIKGTPIADQISPLLTFVFGASVLLTLLIACANVAILMIAQWTTREAETAVRAALGATRWRLVRALVTEAVVLAAIAGVFGLCVTFAMRGIFVSRTTTDMAYLNLAIDPAIFWQAAVITILTGVVAGIGPALFETRRLQMDPLRGIATSDRARHRWSHALVVLEITVTLALLVVTASMVDQYQRGQGADYGFDADRFLVAIVARQAGVPTESLKEAVGRVPGVDAVAAATALPFAGRGPIQPVSAAATDEQSVRAERIAVTPEFFTTLEIAVRAGRTFGERDSPNGRTAVVNETLAKELFASDAVGRQLWLDGIPYDIIGVVADYAFSPIEVRQPAAKAFFRLPTGADEPAGVRFLVRTSNPAALVQPVRRALQNVAPGVTVTNAYTIRQMVSLQGQEMLAGSAPFFPLIVIGMLLMSSGVYAVLSFAITRRSREIAVRVAIGASRRDQVRLVAMHSLRLLALGSACGIGFTFALSRIARASGGGGSLYDPPWVAFVLPVLLVLLAGMLATWIPTRRVLRINPAVLLRTN